MAKLAVTILMRYRRMWSDPGSSAAMEINWDDGDTMAWDDADGSWVGWD